MARIFNGVHGRHIKGYRPELKIDSVLKVSFEVENIPLIWICLWHIFDTLCLLTELYVRARSEKYTVSNDSLTLPDVANQAIIDEEKKDGFRS
ncbi:MAG: hypothetical protein QNJ54_22835 [Prochloraceae cyanobacterium]|nr:hypothetical protein [Prochloraceae cyanobacterium]